MKRPVLCILAIFVIWAVTPGHPFAQAEAQSAAPLRATLANGMRAIVLADKLAPVATTMMLYDVGDDDDTLPGIAHATEHMLFRGTTDLSAGQLANIAARMGAEYNAATADEDTVYYYKLPSEYVDVALHIEADRMTNATITAAAWATERGAIEEEIRGRESGPSFKIGTSLRKVFFAGTPFADAGPGTVESFEHMTADQIRSFYHSWYQPANATIIVAGDVDPQATLAAIRRFFEQIPSAPLPAHKKIEIPALTSTTLQTTIDFPIGFGALAYRLPGTIDPDFAAANVLGQILNGGRSALADLIASGKVLYAFNVSSAFPEVGADFIGAIPVAGSQPESVRALLAGVVDGYRTNGVPPDLVEAAKARLLADQAYTQGSISGLGRVWATALESRRDGPDALYGAIESVTPADVDRLLRTYFAPEHQIAVVVSAKPTGTSPGRDVGGSAEHVGFTPTMHEPLPAWAQQALQAPLRAPDTDLVRVHRLPNGLTYAFRRESVAPAVVLKGYIRTDPLLYVPPGKDGLSTVVDSILSWGTTTYDRKGYEAQFDAISAKASVGTSFELAVRSKDFERAVELLADGLLHPAFPADAFAVIKAQGVQAFTLSAKIPKTRIEIAQQLALYPPGDPRRRTTTGRTFSAITLDDVKRYYAFAYRPDETTLAVVGDVSPERVEAALVKYFGAWKAKGPAPTFAYPKIKSGNGTGGGNVILRSATNTQTEVTLKEVFPMQIGDADYVPLQLANTILSGEQTGSLLFEELRTARGFVYTPGSSFGVDSSGARFSVSFATDSKNASKAIALVGAIVRRLQTHPLPEVDVQRAKALLVASRVLPLDSYGGIADDILSEPKAGFAFDANDSAYWKELLTTTPVQIERAMRRINPDKFVRIVVEPGG